MKKWNKELLLETTSDEVVKLSSELAERISPFFVDEHPGVIAGALVLIVGRFFAGHHPEIRDESFKIFCKAVKGCADDEADDLWRKAKETP